MGNLLFINIFYDVFSLPLFAKNNSPFTFAWSRLSKVQFKIINFFFLNGSFTTSPRIAKISLTGALKKQRI